MSRRTRDKVVDLFAALREAVRKPAPTPPATFVHACGACARGDHGDCSGWCHCAHGTPPAEPGDLEAVFTDAREKLAQRKEWEITSETRSEIARMEATATPPAERPKCGTCGGSGEDPRHAPQVINGHAVATACDACQGSGLKEGTP